LFLKTDGAGNLSFDSLSFSTPLTVIGNATAGSEIRLPEDTDNGSNYVALKAADNLTANLTLTLPSADGTSGQVLQTNGSGVLSFGGAGKVLQVVSTVVTTASSTSLTTTQADIPSLSVSITPTSASNKILILWKIMFSNSSGDGMQGFLQRSGTNIAIGSTGALGTLATIPFLTANSNNYWGFDASGSYLDSPSSTSALTYKFQAAANSGTITLYINRSGRGSADGCYISTITAMEIKG